MPTMEPLQPCEAFNFNKTNNLLTGRFNDDFLQIIIQIEDVNVGLNTVEISLSENLISDEDWNINCEDIFESQSMQLLSNFAQCSWGESSTDDNEINEIIVHLSGLALLETNSSLMIKAGVFQYCDDNCCNTNNDTIVIESILMPNETDITTPVIVLSNIPTTIGICDHLTLDARNSYNLGMLFLFFFHYFVCFECFEYSCGFVVSWSQSRALYVVIQENTTQVDVPVCLNGV